MNKVWPSLVVFGISAVALFAQNTIDTRAQATDWEEINFEFNQSVLTDGFPSLLRLADLLKQHSDYKVTLTGNADQIGGNQANNALSLRRAEAVSAFLRKYGASQGQIQTKGDGKNNPAIPSMGPNARFVNRRVVVQVTTPDGRQIGDGSMSSAIVEFETYSRAQLGKIDAMTAQLRNLEQQLQSLRGDLATLPGIKQDTTAIRQDTASIKQDTTAIRQDTGNLVARPVPLSEEQTTRIAQAAADYALTQSAIRNQKYSLIGLSGGPTFGGGRNGIYSTSVFAKGFIPFGNGKTPDEHGTHALQVEGEWNYYHRRDERPDGRNEGAFNIGLVNRFNHLQIGTFGQFDYVNLNLYRGGALLGAGVVNIDYVMRGLSIGVFGAKGFRPDANVSTIISGPLPRPAFLRYQDQVGFQSTGVLGRNMELHAAVAFKKRYLTGVRAAADVKLTYWASNNLGLFAQVDENPGLQTSFVPGYRLVFGIQFGSWLRPARYNSTGAVPAYVPAARYEVIPR